MRRVWLALLALSFSLALAPLARVEAQGVLVTPAVRKLSPRPLTGTLTDLGFAPRFRPLDNSLRPKGSLRLLGASSRGLRQESRDGIFSVPHFDASFAHEGKTYTLSMVGSAPQLEGTDVETQIIPIRFVLPYVDANNEQILLDGTTKVSNVLKSPVYSPTAFPTGFNQFGNALMRTTFWNAMGPGKDWFVHLQRSVLPTVDIEVPPESVSAYDLGNGTFLALISADFFVSQLNTIFEVGHFDRDVLPIFLTYNSLLYVGNTSNCCILGFHGAFVAGQVGPTRLVQTYVWADWNDPGIFGSPFDETIADVHALSHEVSEWLNDPFTNNVVPFFQNGETGCDNLLETGDQLVGFSVPITQNGFTYHPQTQNLLQFFGREGESSALGATYRFPEDPSVPNIVSTACAPTP